MIILRLGLFQISFNVFAFIPQRQNTDQLKQLSWTAFDKNVNPVLKTTGWSKKTAESLWHHTFATVHHSHAVFSKMFQKKFFT